MYTPMSDREVTGFIRVVQAAVRLRVEGSEFLEKAVVYVAWLEQENKRLKRKVVSLEED